MVQGQCRSVASVDFPAFCLFCTSALQFYPFNAVKDQTAGRPTACRACRSTRRLLTPAKHHFTVRQKGSPAAAAVAARIGPLIDKDGSWELARRDQLMFVLRELAAKGDPAKDEEGLLLLRRQDVEQECDRLFPGRPGCT